MDAYSEIINTSLTWDDVARINKNLSEKSTDAQLAASGIFRIRFAPKPTPVAYQAVREIAPVKVDGKYYARYEVYDMFPRSVTDPITGETLTVQQQKDQYDAALLNEQKLKVSQERNRLMAQHLTPYTGDVLVWEDLNNVQKQQLKYYRSQLLAIEQQAGYPYNVVWPTPPNISWVVVVEQDG